MRPSILIVDNEQVILDGLTRFLSEDYIVFQAVHGREAIEILEKNMCINIVLSDVMMHYYSLCIGLYPRDLQPERAFLFVGDHEAHPLYFRYIQTWSILNDPSPEDRYKCVK